MKVILFGATGMVGQGVLMECHEDPNVESVLIVGRTPCGDDHEKVRELLLQDFFDYSSIEDELTGYDACFFCIGVSSAGMSEEKYRHLTCDLTLRAAETLARLNPRMTFCYVSAAGADRTGGGRVMWTRVRGETENRLLDLPFKAAFMFRPAYIQPQKGARSKTKLYQAFYTVGGWLYPVWEALFPKYVTTTESMGKAMINVSLRGYEKPVLETPDINSLAGDP